jgi:isopenicillin N synthase-like dioxygenase
MTKFYWELNKSAMSILEALISSIELTEEEANNVRKLHTGHDNQLRLLHYPPITDDRLDDKRASRLGAHTDWRYILTPNLQFMTFQDSY